MPIYTYENEETGERVELLQSVNDNHSYSVGGVKWRRVWDTFTIGGGKIDPFSEKQFMDKTANGGTMDDLWQRSGEWSAMRAEKCGGVDPIKAKAEEKQKAKDRAEVARRRAEIRKAKKEKK